MRSASNPMQALLREQMGIDTFAIDGDEAAPGYSWLERPERSKSPARAPRSR